MLGIRVIGPLATVCAALTSTHAQPTAAVHPATSAEIRDIRYDVTFDHTTGPLRLLKVATTFSVTGNGPVLLSLPEWTPGAYEISNFARWVMDFSATGDGRPLSWSKQDYDTWRVDAAGAKSVTVSFSYAADTLDNAMAWSRRDFLLFNGTNVFLYPEGRSLDYPAVVTLHTDPGWRVVTGMHADGTNSYRATNYHDLVDMPFFVGRFDVDSAQIVGQVGTICRRIPQGA